MFTKPSLRLLATLSTTPDKSIAYVLRILYPNSNFFLNFGSAISSAMTPLHLVNDKGSSMKYPSNLVSNTSNNASQIKTNVNEIFFYFWHFVLFIKLYDFYLNSKECSSKFFMAYLVETSRCIRKCTQNRNYSTTYYSSTLAFDEIMYIHLSMNLVVEYQFVNFQT